MEKDKYAKVKIRPHRAERIDLLQEFLDPSYVLECEQSATAGDTGLLLLFGLRSIDETLPNFDARWDLKEDAVDVDLVPLSSTSRLFKTGSQGYRGHHSKNLGHYRYQIDIAIPNRDVFRGVLELDANGILYLRDEARLIVTDTVKISYADTGKEIKL
jgi:hypothetical protein